MDKNCFGKLLDQPGSLTADEWDELRRERDKYPFCAPLQVLSLLADKVSQAPLWEKRTLPLVSLYVQDVDHLYRQLESVSRPAPAASPLQAQPQPPVSAPASAEVDNGPFDVLQEINSYQEISFKTAPKSVILSNFLEKDAGIQLPDTGESDVSVPELAKKSVLPDEMLESETLAVILEKQGKLAQSLAMYEKLLVNNPEKSSIFAVRIAELKARLSQDIK